MSFLQRLKDRNINTSFIHSDETSKVSSGKVLQLAVDIYETDNMLTVYAQCAGCSMDKINVSIENDGQIILLEGTQDRPRKGVLGESGAFIVQECQWGSFYRRIILPSRVNINKAEAQVKNAVLILNLPF